MKQIRITPLYLLILITTLFSPASHALLLGNTLQLDREYGINFNNLSNLSSTTTGPIGAEIEVGPAHYNHLTIDFSDNEMLLSSESKFGSSFGYGSSPNCCIFNGWRFTDISGISDFESVSIVSNDIIGFDTSNILFGDEYFFLNFRGLRLADGDQLKLSFNTIPANVSEPFSMLIITFGLITLGAFRKKTDQ